MDLEHMDSLHFWDWAIQCTCTILTWLALLFVILGNLSIPQRIYSCLVAGGIIEIVMCTSRRKIEICETWILGPGLRVNIWKCVCGCKMMMSLADVCSQIPIRVQVGKSLAGDKICPRQLCNAPDSTLQCNLLLYYLNSAFKLSKLM